MSDGEPSSVRVPLEQMAAFGNNLLEAAGATPGNASIVVDHLIEADAMGLRSHGVMRIPQYLDEIASGEVEPRAEPIFAPGLPGRAAAEGNKAFGQVVGVAMARESVRLARRNGVAFVTGRHMGHTGRIGAYPEIIAEAGMIGIAVCSGPRSGHWVAPFGGREGRLATNPIAYAFPVAGAPPVVADFSTSVVPEGVVRSLRNRRLPVPAGALRDADGQPTQDPGVLYQTPRGTIQPLGGAFGYRGTALGILVDVLAALLAEDEADDLGRAGSNLAMLAIRPDGGFARRAERMGTYLRSSPPVDGAHSVMLPGEREQRAARLAGQGSILVDGPTWAALVAAAVGKRIATPSALEASE